MARPRHPLRIEAVELYLSNGHESANEIARSLGSAAHTIRRWVREDCGVVYVEGFEGSWEPVPRRVRLSDYTDRVNELRIAGLSFEEIATELELSGRAAALRASQKGGLGRRDSQITLDQLLRNKK